MKKNILLYLMLTYMVLSAHYFNGCDGIKKKKLLKALLIGAALKPKTKILPLPLPLPLPIPFKIEKHVPYPEPIPYPVYKHVPYPEPIFIHDSYGHGGGHGGYGGGYGGGYW